MVMDGHKSDVRERESVRRWKKTKCDDEVQVVLFLV